MEKPKVENKPYTDEDVPKLFEDLLARNASWLSKVKNGEALVRRAYEIAFEAHKPQRRKSKEPYIIHPLFVAQYASEICPYDIDVILAALLHDVVEDSEVSIQDIQNAFPERPALAQIVDGLTKFKHVTKLDDSEQVANYRRLLTQTMDDNPRIILVKLADRLHNMQTLGFQEKHKLQKIASETLQFYVPIADRLGLYTIKSELEDLSFKNLNPAEYANIEKLFALHRDRLSRVHREMKERITRILAPTQLKYELTSREKSPYSTFKKIDKKHIPFEDIYDLVALRIIFEPRPDIPEKTQCWFIYILLTEHFLPLRERTRDWVSTPKVNGYEALHCTLLDKNGQWVEVQIRTRRMDDYAEHGGASHALYKKEQDFQNGADLSEVRRMLSTISASYEMSSSAFMAHLSTDLFKNRMAVYERIYTESEEGRSRHSEPFYLPHGSYVLDFAYLKDKNIGNRAIAARVNGILVSLAYKLRAGDEIEIITAPSQYPTKAWTDYVYSPLARNSIDQARASRKKLLIEKGRVRLNEIFNRLEEEYSKEIIDSLLSSFYVQTVDELCLGLVSGVINPQLLARKVRRALRRKARHRRWLQTTDFIRVKILHRSSCLVPVQQDEQVAPTAHNTQYRLITSPCCCALPGDPDVIGVLDVDAGENVVRVHKANCSEAHRFLSQYGKLVRKDFDWSQSTGVPYPTHIYIRGLDRTNLLKDIFGVFGERFNDINITRADLRSDGEYFQGVISFSLMHIDQLKMLSDALYRLVGVQRVYRLDIPSSYEWLDKK